MLPSESLLCAAQDAVDLGPCRGDPLLPVLVLGGRRDRVRPLALRGLEPEVVRHVSRKCAPGRVACSLTVRPLARTPNRIQWTTESIETPTRSAIRPAFTIVSSVSAGFGAFGFGGFVRMIGLDCSACIGCPWEKESNPDFEARNGRESRCPNLSGSRPFTALGQDGEKAIRPFLSSPRDQTRGFSAAALAHVNPADPEAAKVLLELAANEDLGIPS